MSSRKNYQTTEYPNIYKNAYWGSFSVSDNLNPEIIKNRNEFIKRFKITKYKKITEHQWRKQNWEWDGSTIISYNRIDIDHQEYYEDIYGRMIYVCSQYNPYPLYKQMKPIYTLDNWSGYKIAETTKSKKILMKQIFDKFPPEISKYIQTYLTK
jgi:hypothetical protein